MTGIKVFEKVHLIIFTCKLTKVIIVKHLKNKYYYYYFIGGL